MTFNLQSLWQKRLFMNCDNINFKIKNVVIAWNYRILKVKILFFGRLFHTPVNKVCKNSHEILATSMFL